MSVAIRDQIGVSGISIFPVTRGQALPQIGQGFDIVKCEPLASNGLAAQPPMTDAPLQLGDEQFFSIYDHSTFQDALAFDISTSGGGWGAEEGMCASASARFSTSSTSYIIQFNAAKTSRQTLINASATLSDAAKTILTTQGAGKFIDRYGAYFVAGYIFGRSCKASYNIQFSTTEMMTSFKASFSESASELGFSEKTSTDISNALSKSNTTAQTSASQNSIGFDARSVAQLSDLEALIKEYDAAPIPADAAVSVLVLPWEYLEQVNTIMSASLDMDTLATVARLLNALTFIRSTADDFIQREQFVGGTQLLAIRTARQQAQDQADQIKDILSQAAATQAQVSVSEQVDGLTINGTFFPNTDALAAALNHALRHFVLSWKAWVDGGRSEPLLAQLVDLNGKAVATSNNGMTVDCSQGSDFTWSLDGNGNWSGTAGTQSMYYTLARFSSDGWNMAIILDRAAGTLQCIGRGANQTLAQNPRSAVLTIRGVTNTESQASADSDVVIACNLQGGFYRVCAC